MTLCHVVGARPNFIKLASVYRSLADQVLQIVIHTGQHYDANMSSIFFDELDIPEPDYHLEVGSGSHGEQTGKMIQALDPLLLSVKPDQVIVYGDTNSTLAGALSAVKLHIPVAHVEAGLRSFNRQMPEEINRVVTDHISRLLLAPTRVAVENLRREGIDGANVHLVGDVMFDSSLYYGAKAERDSRILDRLSLERRGYVLATVHRAENTDSLEPLSAIFSALSTMAAELPVVFPLHPRTRAALRSRGLFKKSLAGLQVIEPVGYLDMVLLERNARLVVTDSGGVQKEAFFFGVPCVTLRAETEWTELVDLEWNRLAPPVSLEAILSVVRASLSSGPGCVAAPYGNGSSSRIIAELLLKRESGKPVSGANGALSGRT